MATGDYITVQELTDWNADPSYGAQDAARYQAAITAASQSIDSWCGRRFYADANASARQYVPWTHGGPLWVDDFYTTTSLAVATDEAVDGTFEQSWTITTDFRVAPFNALLGSGETGVYYQIVPTGTRSWPISSYGLPTVQVTAKWGWTTTPPSVRQACFVLASKLVKLKDAPLGVAGFGEFGAVRVQGNRDVEMLLAPYRRMDRVPGIA